MSGMYCFCKCLHKNNYYCDYRKLQINIQYPGIYIMDTNTDYPISYTYTVLVSYILASTEKTKRCELITFIER